MGSNNPTSLLFIGVYLQCVSNSCDYKNVYTTQLNTIKGIISHFIDNSSVIMIGDFQSYPSIERTSRTAKQNALSNCLENFLTDNELTPVDITQGVGPCFTYHHQSLGYQSYIDHVCVSRSVPPDHV